MRKEIEVLLADMYDSFDINSDDDTKDDFWSALSEKEKYDVNSKYLRQIGNPEYDYLVCWEPGRLDTDKEVTEYPTFYELDHEWWEFQKGARWDSIEEMKEWMEKNPAQTTPERVAQSINSFNEVYSDGYSIYLSGDWYRLIENDVFIYSQMISAKWYLFYEAESYLDTLQEENIPYSFKGDDDDFLSVLNERDPRKIYNANGRELELDSYQNKIRDYQSNQLLSHIDFIIRKYKIVFSGKTFRVDKGYEPDNFDPFTDFIFFDEESLKNVKTKQFLKTFGENQLSFVEFEKMIHELKELVKVDFDRIYNSNRVKFSS